MELVHCCRCSARLTDIWWGCPMKMCGQCCQLEHQGAHDMAHNPICQACHEEIDVITAVVNPARGILCSHCAQSVPPEMDCTDPLRSSSLHPWKRMRIEYTEPISTAAVHPCAETNPLIPSEGLEGNKQEVFERGFRGGFSQGFLAGFSCLFAMFVV